MLNQKKIHSTAAIALIVLTQINIVIGLKKANTHFYVSNWWILIEVTIFVAVLAISEFYY